MKKKQHKNVIEDLTLSKIGNLHRFQKVVKFSIEIGAKGIDLTTNLVIRGKKKNYGQLREKWFFQKNEADSWILYQIK